MVSTVPKVWWAQWILLVDDDAEDSDDGESGGCGGEWRGGASGPGVAAVSSQDQEPGTLHTHPHWPHLQLCLEVNVIGAQSSCFPLSGQEE